MTRFHKMTPVIAGSRVLSSAAVQYFVAEAYAPPPNGSISATMRSNSGRVKNAADTK